MERTAIYLTKKLVQRNIIDKNNVTIYETGLTLIISDIINFLIIIVIGLITNTFWYSCLYLMMLVIVRRFSGGFHAKTYNRCRLVTAGTYILIILVNELIINHWITYAMFFNVISIITMILFAPIRHPNKELTSTEIKANKLFALITTILSSILSIALIVLNRKTGLVISLILFAITVLMYAGLLTNRKGGITK